MGTVWAVGAWAANTWGADTWADTAATYNPVARPGEHHRTVVLAQISASTMSSSVTRTELSEV